MRQTICMLAILVTCFSGTGILLGIIEKDETFTIVGIGSGIVAYGLYELLKRMK